jgi:hypothetical protein
LDGGELEVAGERDEMEYGFMEDGGILAKSSVV